MFDPFSRSRYKIHSNIWRVEIYIYIYIYIQSYVYRPAMNLRTWPSEHAARLALRQLIERNVIVMLQYCKNRAYQSTRGYQPYQLTPKPHVLPVLRHLTTKLNIFLPFWNKIYPKANSWTFNGFYKIIFLSFFWHVIKNLQKKNLAYLNGKLTHNWLIAFV